MKKVIMTEKAPIPSAPYSQALKVGNTIYVSGQRPVNVFTGKIPESIEEQTIQVFTNIKNILEAGGSSMGDIVKVSVFLADLKDFEAFNKIYGQFFSEPYPVRTTIGCQLRGILVEVDVVAVIG